MTPEASLDAGLDVLSVRKLARRSVPRIAWQVFGSARHVSGRDIDYVHDASHVLVTSNEPFPVQVDGDSLGDHRRLEVRARARGPLGRRLSRLHQVPGRRRRHSWIPHSHLDRPAQRPARSGSPAKRIRVHGAQPIEL